MSERYRLVAIFGLIFVAVFSLYLFTLAPGVVGGDSGEHQLAVPLLGIPHTTGYPLYILMGKVWTMLIPFGSMAWRVNLFSAFGGALAAALTGLVVYQLSLEINPAVSRLAWAGAIVAGITLAMGLTFWQWSVIAGVRPFTVCFFALLTLQAVLWARQRRQGELQAAWRTLCWLALTVGLSLTHHRTTLFYLPSLILWIAWYDRSLWRQPRRLFSLVGLALLPLLLYLFIYFRGINHSPYSHEEIRDWQSFWFLIGSGDSTGLFLSIDPAYLPSRLAFLWADLLTQLSLPGVLLAGLGGLWLFIRYPSQFYFQALLMFILLLFTLDFEVVNLNEAPAWYLMPAHFLLTVWVGLGVNTILDFGFRLRAPGGILDFGHRNQIFEKGRQKSNLAPYVLRFTFHPSRITHYALRTTHYEAALLLTLSLLTLLTYYLGWPNWQTQYAAATTPLDDWRQLLRGSQGQRLVESSLPYVEPGSLIYGDWEQYTPYRYYQLVVGLRPDVTVRLPLNEWPEKVAAAHVAGQPVYFSRKPADLTGTPYLTMLGPLIYLQTGPNFTVPSDIQPLKANFENELELVGYRAEITPQQGPGGVEAGSILQLMVYWRAPVKMKWDYALSLRLLDPAGQEVYKKDATHPVLSSYPTTLWTPGEVVGDYYELLLPPDIGPLSLMLLPYRTEAPGVWHNLTLNGTEPAQEGLILGPFEPLTLAASR